MPTLNGNGPWVREWEDEQESGRINGRVGGWAGAGFLSGAVDERMVGKGEGVAGTGKGCR